MKIMCAPGHHHNNFQATHALGHMMYGYPLLVPMNQRALIFILQVSVDPWLEALKTSGFKLMLQWLVLQWLYHQRITFFQQKGQIFNLKIACFFGQYKVLGKFYIFRHFSKFLGRYRRWTIADRIDETI